MSHVNARPDDLRRLAVEIEGAQKTIDDAVQRLWATLHSASWRDPVRDQFEGELEDVMSRLRSFHERADEMKPWLGRKAGELERFLSR